MLVSYKDMRRRLIELIIKYSFQSSEELKFKLAHAGMSRFYFNCKGVTLDPEGQWLIGNLVFERIRGLGIQAIGGLTLGADPIATATALVSWLQKEPIQAFVVRKTIKDHGIIAQIEGKIGPGDRIAVVDDAVTTGTSTLEAIRACRENKLEIVKVILLVDRQEANGRENILAAVPEFEALFTRDEIMEAHNKLQSLKKANK